MPRPGEDRSDVGGAAQFNNIGPVPLSAPAFSSLVPLSAPYRTRPAFSSRVKIAPTSAGPPSLTISDPSRFQLAV